MGDRPTSGEEGSGEARGTNAGSGLVKEGFDQLVVGRQPGLLDGHLAWPFCSDASISHS